MALTPGARLGVYEITAPIGEGGMGQVYRARDTKLDRDVAIKILPEAFAHDADRLARFQREAKTLASLNHPNIAAIHGLEESAGMTALVMELVEGDDLSQRIARGAIPLDEALPIAKQIAEALEAAHEQGIIHRDLKPANIKVRADGTVKVLDFGLAKAMEPAVGSSPSMSMSPTITTPAMTQAGMILGTAAYMSPEQARGRTVDKRADIWAFGVVLFEMLTGHAAFEGDDVPEILGAVLKSEPNWTRLPSDLQASIPKLLRLCLQKDLKKRRQSAGDVRIDLEQASGESMTATSAAPPARASRLPWIVAALLAVSTIAAVAVALHPTTEAPEMRLQINTPPTASPMQFSLSPDGLKLAFVASGDGFERLWLRPLDKTDAQPMAGTEGAQHPFWSPDSRSIGFFASGKLYRVDSVGGRPQVLANAPVGRGGTWNRDGVIVFAPTSLSPLMRVAASGGEPVPLTKLDAPRSIAHKYPQYLPDGRHFLFYAQGSAAGIYLGTLDGGDPKRLVPSDAAGAYLAPDRLAYVRQGLLVAQRLDVEQGELTGDPETLADAVDVEPILNVAGFSVSADSRVAYRAGVIRRNQLSWYDRTGKTVGVAGEPDVSSLQYAELSPDGRRVAMDRLVQGNRDVWLMDLDRGGMTRFTFDAALDQAPLWSPDGMRIVFRSTRNGSSDLYMKPSNGAGTEELLLQTPNDKYPLDWSKDGRFLLYAEQDPKTGGDLKALPMTGSERNPVVVMNTPFDERNGQFSPNGRWVAYATNESGRYETVVQPFPKPTGKWQVSMEGGLQPRWRADGRELYFIAPNGELMSASVNPSDATFGAVVSVALFQTLILGGGTNLPSKPYYAVSRDDRFLILHPTDDVTVSPITLLLNWKPPAK